MDLELLGQIYTAGIFVFIVVLLVMAPTDAGQELLIVPIAAFVWPLALVLILAILAYVCWTDRRPGKVFPKAVVLALKKAKDPN